MLNENEKNRYLRHIHLPMFGEVMQTKLKRASVLVIGAGGLGAPVLNYLTAAGIGTIGIVDMDVVEETNLQRQILFTSEHIGQSKTMVAVDRLKKLNPNVCFKTWNNTYTKANAVEIANQFDLIVNCSDNYDTRYTSDEASKQLSIPLVMGSVHNYEGQVAVFNYQNSPSYADAFPEAPDKTLQNQQDLGVLGVLPSITGSLQASEVIKIITGIGEPLSGKILVFSLLDNTFRTFKL